jgi:ribosomal protein S12 methylthiotransferase accessory factor
MGTCAGIYVLSFCQQHGLSANDVYLTQTVETDPATHLVSKVSLTIHVPASFPRKYEAALIRSAELCAVKRSLETPPAITVETQFG